MVSTLNVLPASLPSAKNIMIIIILYQACSIYVAPTEVYDFLGEKTEANGDQVFSITGIFSFILYFFASKSKYYRSFIFVCMY